MGMDSQSEHRELEDEDDPPRSAASSSSVRSAPGILEGPDPEDLADRGGR